MGTVRAFIPAKLRERNGRHIAISLRVKTAVLSVN